VRERDPVRPALAAGFCIIVYYFTLLFVTPSLNFLGNDLLAVTLTTLLAACVWNALGMAIFESRKLPDLGLNWDRGSAGNLLKGLALGAGAASLVIIAPALAGLAHFERLPDADVSVQSILLTPLLLLCGAAGEEIAFRGFALQSLMRGYGTWAAILGMGALFGILHGANPGATTLAVVNTAGFGVLFGVALLRTHDLWLPIGLHFGWNAALPFLGVGLSGLTIRVTAYQLVWKAGNLWSGGTYGPEASLLASGVLIVLFVAVCKIPLARGHAYLLESPEEETAEPQPAP
jgi:membrane protease YdiL (CAAX protease family)